MKCRQPKLCIGLTLWRWSGDQDGRLSNDNIKDWMDLNLAQLEFLTENVLEIQF
jgi:hypothetical protein